MICIGCGLKSEDEPSVTPRSDEKPRCNDCLRDALYGPWKPDDWYAEQVKLMADRAPA